MMISKKVLASEIEAIKEDVKSLTDIVVTDELKSLRNDKKRFEEQSELLSHLRFRIKSARYMDGEQGNKIVIIYQLPMITIPLNEKGEPAEKNDFFYAVNALGLVGIEDYQAIQNALEDAKKASENNIYKK